MIIFDCIKKNSRIIAFMFHTYVTFPLLKSSKRAKA